MNNRNYNKKGSASGGSFMLTLVVLAIIGALMANVVVHRLYPQSYRQYIEQSCTEFGVDESLVYAVIHTESGFDPMARSEVGAMGLMQIMPETFSWLQSKLPPESELSPDALYDPQTNIRYGVYFLSLLEQQFGADVLTVAAYHAGQGKVASWLSSEQVSQGSAAADIPSSATGHYVSKVQRAREIYRKLYFN
ncbi:MAG: lytic transglycosylase domain-containing protein [Clostridia bacterium]|nr:lytic transglycosylase domain-containing protein [Clostridia bacterium]